MYYIVSVKKGAGEEPVNLMQSNGFRFSAWNGSDDLIDLSTTQAGCNLINTFQKVLQDVRRVMVIIVICWDRYP